MIEYGFAILFVCFLTIMDRESRPYALTLLGGWLAGFLGWEFWPVISLVSASVLFWLHLRTRALWSAGVASLAGVMLCVDVAYLWFRSQGIPVEAEYAMTLNVGLLGQLVLVGHRGGINGFFGIRDRLSRGLRRGRRYRDA